MIIPTRIPASRRSLTRHRSAEPDWRSFGLGAAAFLVLAAFCLFAVARLGS